MKHLFNGSIYCEGEIYTARDSRDNYITYGKTLNDCQVEVYKYYSKLFPKEVFEIKYDKKIACWNFSGFYSKRNKKKTKLNQKVSIPKGNYTKNLVKVL